MDTKKWWNVFFMVGSMVLFFAVFWMFLSWERALIISGSLFFHEYGHIFAMQRYGMKVKGMYFIPFIGGAAVPASRMPSQESDVVISLAGPVFGLGLAIVTAIAYAMTGWSILGVAVVFMALLNVFNLIPIFPLDGGRVLSCIAHSVNPKIGTILMGGSVFLGIGMFFLTGHILILLVVLWAMSAFMDFIQEPPERKRNILILQGMHDALVKHGDINHPTYRVYEERILKRMSNLRELPPLSSQWIAIAVGSWMMIVSSFCTLTIVMVLNSAVVEGLKTFFQP